MTEITTVVCIRHGESNLNAKRKVAGQNGDTGLTENGRGQAQAVAPSIRRFPITAVISSPLPRAMETAGIIFPDLPLATHEGLKEQYIGTAGEQEMQTREEFAKGLLLRMAEIADEVNGLAPEELKRYVLVDGMESDETVATRVNDTFLELVQQHRGETIAVVFHGAALRLWLIHNGYGNKRRFRTGTVHNCAYMVLEHDGEKFEVKEVSGITEAPDDGKSHQAEGIVGFYVKGI